MYKVNMTLADSFNESGCGPNYEHDEEHNEEHDEGDYLPMCTTQIITP